MVKLTREEIEFDFDGAQFDLTSEKDRDLLGWIFNQFLYGEVTGIQCGYWLYRAPHLNAAAFLSKQASEEISHVRGILRILTLLEQKPKPAHRLTKFFSTGMMGGSWGEHVAIEMALGEGLVLHIFYALIQTIPSPEIQKIIENAVREEETHVAFGENETIAWVDRHPGDASYLRSQARVQLFFLKRFKKIIAKKFSSGEFSSHPVMSRFDRLYDHILSTFSKRLEVIGLSTGKESEPGLLETAGHLLVIPFKKLLQKVRSRPLLTQTYLSDPILKRESERS